MTEDWDKIKWEQLNQRSRWYSAQLWYIPFAYVGIVGLAFDKILRLSYPLNSIGLIFLGIFSLSVFVHVSAIKFNERKAVRNMQDIEGSSPISGISSGQWYLNFIWYIKWMICVASYFFIGYGLYLIETTTTWQKVLLWIPLLLLTILYGVISRKDYVRNRDLLNKIKNTE